MFFGFIFFSYEEVKDKFVTMENSSNACVMGVGEVVQKFTFGSTTTLINVHYVSNVRWNLAENL